MTLSSRIQSFLKTFRLPLVVLLAGLILLTIPAEERHRSGDPASVSRLVEERLGAALDELDLRMQEEGLLEELPEDMSVYRYENDSLVFWKHPLPLINDRIAPGMEPARLLPRQYGAGPIAGLTEDWRFVTLGSKWYLAKLVSNKRDGKVLGALEICDARSRGVDRSVSSRLGLPGVYFISEIPQEIGAPVHYRGEPLFFIGLNPRPGTASEASVLQWLALLCFAVFALLLLGVRRRWSLWGICVLLLTGCYLTARWWGAQLSGHGALFSPVIYADGAIWSSFGDLLTHSLYLSLLLLSVFMMKEDLVDRACRENGRKSRIVILIAVYALFVGALVYFSASCRSFLYNSSLPVNIGISAPSFRYRLLSTLVFTLLLVTSLQLLRIPAEITLRPKGRRVPLPGMLACLVLSFVFALSAFYTLSQVGLEKEKERTLMWAERLTLERDLMMEMRLMGAEKRMIADVYLPLLARAEGGEDLLRSRIMDNYFADFSPNWLIAIHCFGPGEEALLREADRRWKDGEAISPGSRFFLLGDENGLPHYRARIRYPGEKTLSIEIESAAGQEKSSFHSLLSPENSLGELPDPYSFARYVDHRLVSFKGTYPYPTLLDEYAPMQHGALHENDKGWLHYYNHFDGNETVIISRREIPVLTQFSGLFLRMGIILLILLIFIRPGSQIYRQQNSLTRRIGGAVMFALGASLALVVLISIRFVVDSTLEESGKNRAEKIGSIRTLLEKDCYAASDYSQLQNGQLRRSLDEAARMSKCDISLYSPDGSLFMTTAPEVYDKMLLGSRMDDRAYYSLVYQHRRYCRQEETLNGQRFMTIYTPLANRYGETVCLACVPMPPTQVLISAALPHAVLLIVIAFMLLLFSRSVIYRLTDRIFSPLRAMGRKMENSGLEGLEHIRYERDDEIAALVKAYNQMVDMIERSARVMAGRERDKAWSEMARQVAHEIKNPLTPIKLDLQRLIRLKASGKPEWSDKFDELSRIILENIDVLTETANDFSSFAKLYTQEPVEFDLDATLADQMALFDNKEHITLSYVGLKGTLIHGPKPQLIRVFVNLITNAIQSIENAGLEEGRILVCLRKGAEDGMLDITVEDNGPGVAEENIEKLFSPNFTTKTGGAGIGLAMCRNILQMCGGEIRYSRSFTLGGACFTVNLPSGNPN